MKKAFYLFIFPFLFTPTIILHAQNWSRLDGLNGLATNGAILSLNCDASGNVYAAGGFTDSSGNNYVAHYNGNSWSELGALTGGLFNSNIYSLCSDSSGNVYAAGVFTDGNGNNYIAEYNGSNWSKLGMADLNGTSTSEGLYSVCIDPFNHIYAAGGFYNSIGCIYVAEYLDPSLYILGPANQLCINASIYSICSDTSGNIYAAGAFEVNSGIYYVAKYNGNSWSELGGLNSLSANGIIKSICSDAHGNIYAAGNFTDSIGTYFVAKYNGSSWTELGGVNGLSANGTILSICSDVSGNIYAAGAFTNVNGMEYVAQYNGSSWSELGGLNGLSANGIINSICSDTFRNIYAAGNFTDSTGKEFVAKYWVCTGGASVQADTICQSALPYSWNGTVFTSGGTKTISLATTQGCDSMSSLTLTVYPSDTIITAVICPGSAYTIGANIYTTTGTFIDTLISASIYGCDSIITLDLVVLDSSVISYFSLQPSSLPHFWYAINQCSGNELSYLWSWGDSTTSIGDTPSHTYDTAGYYTICVTVTDSMGCSATYCDSNIYLFKDQSGQMVYVQVLPQYPAGINIISANNVNINYYAGAVHFSEALQAPTQLRLYDMPGRLVMQQDNYGGNQWNINSDIAQGAYIIQLQNQSYSLAQKLMILQ